MVDELIIITSTFTPKGSSLSSSRLPAGKFYPLMKAVQVKAANATDGFA